MKVTCGRRPISGAVRPATTARPGVADLPPEALLYGVVWFEGLRRKARSVVLAFESANAADEYASLSGFDDYLVVPLAFLTPTAAHA